MCGSVWLCVALCGLVQNMRLSVIFFSHNTTTKLSIEPLLMYVHR